MKKLSMSTRSIMLLLILLPVLIAFVYVVTQSGPLAPVPVTVIQVENKAITPALFGVGIVEARYSYRIGPTMTGHVLQLDSHVGDKVVAGQVVGEMPEHIVIETRPMPDGTIEVLYLRQIIERRVIDHAYREMRDETGNVFPVPVKLAPRSKVSF